MTVARRESIDVATEVGEEFALPPCGLPLDVLEKIDDGGRRLHPRHTMMRADMALLDLVSTAYIACGGHSGDPIVMARTISALLEHGVTVGAHPSYPDIFGFAQERVVLTDWEFESVIRVQIATIATLAQRAGTRVSTVKCHGALAFDVAYDERIAAIMARTLLSLDEHISLVCMAESPGAAVAEREGIAVVREAYIDRAYDQYGRIVSRSLPGALITDVQAAAEQARSIAVHGTVTTINGARIPMNADTLCLHSDTPGVSFIGAAVAEIFASQNIAISPVKRISASN